LLGFGAVFLVFALWAPSTFLTANAFSSILTSQAVPGIVAIGITLLMIGGEFDLSVGSIVGVSSLVFLSTAVAGLPVPVAILAGLLAGALMGLVNGVLLVATGIPSFIITLGTLLVYRAISLTAISGGRIVRWADYSPAPPTVELPTWLAAVAVLGALAVLGWTFAGLRRTRVAPRLGVGLIGLAGLWLLWTLLTRLGEPAVSLDPFWLLNGRLRLGDLGGNFRVSILWWLGLALVFAFVLTRTRFGNSLSATGGNAEAARAQGIDIDGVRIRAFVLSGTLAALAGVIQTARLKSVDPLRGEGLELEVIAAVVIGGTLLKGGYGSVVGSVIGTSLTGMLRTGLVLVGVPANAFRGAIGALVIAAVVINSLVRRQR
jgi:ribose/xylose/arabinose/galactoside ABC-type transport system permease subunit